MKGVSCVGFYRYRSLPHRCAELHHIREPLGGRRVWWRERGQKKEDLFSEKVSFLNVGADAYIRPQRRCFWREVLRNRLSLTAARQLHHIREPLGGRRERGWKKKARISYGGSLLKCRGDQ